MAAGGTFELAPLNASWAGVTDTVDSLLGALLGYWPAAWSGLWMGGLAATLLALLVVVATRSNSMRPATRHALWVAVLVSFITPGLVASMWRPTWFSSERIVLPASTAPQGSDAPNNVLNDAQQAAQDAATNAAPAEPATTPALLTQSIESLKTTEDTVACEAAPPVETACAPSASDDATNAPAVACTQNNALTCETEREASPSIACDPSPQPRASLPAVVVTQVPIAPPPEPARASSSQPASTTLQPSSLSIWLARLVDVRDAIAALPPIPFVVWLAGAALIVGLRVSRTIRVQRLIRQSEPATDAVQREVDAAARSIGLASTPITLVTEARISPLVYSAPSCRGLRSTLVLPLDLWVTLDYSSRRTVLVHELAHVRRGDHRLCWLESFVAVLFWWHPLAWWVRARVREAAEAACDTWVTATCPQSRRHYAEALVLATSFLSSTTDRSSRTQQTACASVSVGFVTGRSRKLARRITMVMTSRFAPRMSLVGSTAAALALGLGAIVAPGLACPPSQCEPSSEGGKPAQLRVLRGLPGPKATPGPAFGAGPSTSSSTSPFWGEAPAIDAMTDTIAPASPGVVAPNAINSAADGEIIQRSYQLPRGKLNALVNLMARNDVPIFIENHGDSILVNATAPQHEIFAAFVQMIHPEGPQLRGSARTLSPRFGSQASARDAARAAAERELEAAKAELDRLLAEHDRLETSVDRARDSADEARDRADDLREHLDELATQRETLRRRGIDAPDADQALSQALAALQTRVGVTAQQAIAAEQQAKSDEARMRQVELTIERIEERLEAIAEALEAAGIVDTIESEEAVETEIAPLAPEVVDTAPAAVPSVSIAPAPAAAPAPELAPHSVRAPLPPTGAAAPAAPSAPLAPLAPASR